MHILVTNDDGPPSPESSPYVHALVAHLESAGHVVSVILPHTQRSWIGKAHMIGQPVRPTYYKPGPNVHGEPTGTISEFPSKEGNEWILVDGTPASCVQIGGFHFFEDREPIDLVLSGPNYGRNTTAVFALSSGTMGAALEAALCGFKAIAVSYAFFDKNRDQSVIEAATRHTVRVVEAVYKQWPEDKKVDLYSINVPLVAGVEEARTLWTDMLQNYWRDGSCFDVVEADSPAVEAEKKEGLGHVVHKHKHFAWAPKFKGVYQTVDESTPGNDGWTVQNRMTSVTPLKANFFQAGHELHGKDVEL